MMNSNAFEQVCTLKMNFIALDQILNQTWHLQNKLLMLLGVQFET